MSHFPLVLTTEAAADLLPADAVSAGSWRRTGQIDLADVLFSTTDVPVPDGLPGGAGVVLLVRADRPVHPAVADLLIGAGICVGPAIDADGTSAEPRLRPAAAPARSAGLRPGSTESTPDAGEDLLARVEVEALAATSVLEVTGAAQAVLRLPGTTRDPGPVVAATSWVDGRRWVVLGVLPGEGAGPLILNALIHAARRPPVTSGRRRSDTADLPAWLRLKEAVTRLRPLQVADGSIPDEHFRTLAHELVLTINHSVAELSPRFPHDAEYLTTLAKDFTSWAGNGFAGPDFLDSLQAFHPEAERVDGREHLVVFPMYTQNGNADRNVEAVLIQVIWPEFVGELESGDYSNKMFVPIRFLDFTAGYDTNSAVLFPETIAMREVPKFHWGAIFADREAARFRTVVGAAAQVTRLALPPDAARLLADQELAEQTFVMWDLIHDRTHMHGDLPFDPFMIKQRMPYFLYTLEELRCDLTAFREAVRLEKDGVAHARLVQYAILFDRIFRFPISGTRVRNYDGLGGQLLFAWLHQHHVLNWTDNRLSIDWSEVTEPVLELGRQIEELYWHSIDRPKIAHWLAAYDLVSGTVTPHPASRWAKGADALPLEGPPKGLTDLMMPDEFPLSMFYEALQRKLSGVVAGTAGITG